MKTIKHVGTRLSALLTGRAANRNPITVFEVKALYDAAFEERAQARQCLRTFRGLLKRAERLDAAYRAQLAADCHRLYGTAV